MKEDIKRLESKARDLRKRVLELSLEKGEAHLGGSFSEIEILISLYDFVLTEEDKFILSKGHASLPWYVLLQEKGYNPKITTHPDIDVSNGIYCTTGSLGHGFPIGVGMALARKLKKQNGRIYILISDGECETGTTWESTLIAQQHKLDNLVLIVDYNKIQALDWVKNVLNLEDLTCKFQSFNWYVRRINGHSFQELEDAFSKKVESKPYVIIADTIKGKGVSYMENNPEWHGKRVTPERIAKAYKELKDE
jgi:transketolase